MFNKTQIIPLLAGLFGMCAGLLPAYEKGQDFQFPNYIATKLNLRIGSATATLSGNGIHTSPFTLPSSLQNVVTLWVSVYTSPSLYGSRLITYPIVVGHTNGTLEYSTYYEIFKPIGNGMYAVHTNHGCSNVCHTLQVTDCKANS